MNATDGSAHNVALVAMGPAPEASVYVATILPEIGILTAYGRRFRAPRPTAIVADGVERCRRSARHRVTQQRRSRVRCGLLKTLDPASPRSSSAEQLCYI